MFLAYTVQSVQLTSKSHLRTNTNFSQSGSSRHCYRVTLLQKHLYLIVRNDKDNEEATIMMADLAFREPSKSSSSSFYNFVDLTIIIFRKQLSAFL
jgi:hypothetical protein